MKRILLAAAILTLVTNMASQSSAAVITIESYSYDLDQFLGASVTTNVPSSHVHSSTFENANGFDGFELGELASAHFGGDVGDRISLGDFSAQDTLTLTYGTPVAIGPGDSSLFVVFEQASANGYDIEGEHYEISINGGAFVDAANAISKTFITGMGGDGQNQTVFDLTDANFNLNIGDTISTVTIRNLVGNDGTYDPDFLFAARAGTAPLSSSSPVPEPASLAVWGLFGLVGCGVGVYRRRRRKPAPA